jgi:hypothetical protein
MFCGEGAENMTDTAGREMDAWIAEHVMGWEWWRSRHTGRRCLYAPGKNEEWMQELATGDEPLVADWKMISIPRFSADIAAAFEVVEKIKDTFAKGEGFELWWNPSEKFWEVCLEQDYDSCKKTVTADTAPLAICRAAREAMK